MLLFFFGEGLRGAPQIHQSEEHDSNLIGFLHIMQIGFSLNVVWGCNIPVSFLLMSMFVSVYRKRFSFLCNVQLNLYLYLK